MSTFFCTKCGWHRSPRETDPRTIMCGNPSCNYLVTQTNQTKKEVREQLALNLQELCAWSKEYAKGLVDGMGMVEDNALTNCSAILEQLVEAKMLKDKVRRGFMNGTMALEVRTRLLEEYEVLKKEAWTKAFKWFGWDVDVEGFPPTKIETDEEVMERVGDQLNDSLRRHRERGDETLGPGIAVLHGKEVDELPPEEAKDLKRFPKEKN